MSEEIRRYPVNPMYLEIPLFIAIKEKDYYRTSGITPPPSSNGEKFLLVSTSYARHMENLDAARVGGATTSLATPGYTHIQPTPQMDSDDYVDKEVGHSYALWGVTENVARDYHKNGKADIVFVETVQDLAIELKKAKETEDAHPVRTISQESRRPKNGPETKGITDKNAL